MPSHQTFLLSSPDYYKSETKPVNPESARHQWESLKHHIEKYKVNVKVVSGSPKLIDSVYITDTVLIINDFAIIARYHKQSRRGEEELVADYLKHKLKLRIRYLPKEDGLYYEGGGDTRWSHNFTHLWIGYGGGRTTLKGIEAVTSILKEELGIHAPQVHKIKINDRKTFHLDLALLPLPNNRVLYYPTLAIQSINELETVFGKKNMIRVPEKYFFACNSVWIDETHILIPKLPFSDYRQWMAKATGMKVDEVDVSEFHLGNGSVQCMVLRMWNIPITHN
jgi:N-dimethylarginine dimethylaminohydrolase